MGGDGGDRGLACTNLCLWTLSHGLWRAIACLGCWFVESLGLDMMLKTSCK